MAMWNRVNIAGKRFGTLVPVRYDGYRKGAGQWECKCDCGVTKVVSGAALRLGKTVSCGCRTSECRWATASEQALNRRRRGTALSA